MKRLIVILILPIFLFAKYSFELELSKTKAYLNEPILATFTFKYPSLNKPRYIDFKEPKAEYFIVKKVSQNEFKDGNNSVIEYKYIVIPQVAKELKFPYQILRYANLEKKTNYAKWHTLSTSDYRVEVLALPMQSSISGNLELDVNSTKKDKNIALITINLKGIANFDDIKPFKLNIDGATLYSSKPKIEYSSKNSSLKGEFTQKITVISNSKVLVPPITFKYFNTDTELMQTLESKAEIINLKGVQEYSFKSYIYLILGLILGLLIPTLLKLIKRVKIPLEQKIRVASTQKALYKLLLPYTNEYNIQDIVRKLEENIYKNRSYKISKREIIKRIKT